MYWLVSFHVSVPRKKTFMTNVIWLGASTNKLGSWPCVFIQILVIQIMYCNFCSVDSEMQDEFPRLNTYLWESEADKACVLKFSVSSGQFQFPTILNSSIQKQTRISQHCLGKWSEASRSTKNGLGHWNQIQFWILLASFPGHCVPNLTKFCSHTSQGERALGSVKRCGSYSCQNFSFFSFFLYFPLFLTQGLNI
jgi:hypothetical protein